MADGTHKRVKLNVRVTPSKKQEWKNALDEGQTLTSLVETAVDHEIKDEYVLREVIGDIETAADTDVDLSEVNNKIDDLEQTVNSFQTQLDDISTPGSKPDEEEISELAMRLVPHIPTFDDIDGYLQREITQSEDKLDGLKDAMAFARREEPGKYIDATADTIAENVDEDVILVRQALVYLQRKTTEDISSVIIDGNRHWYRGV